MIHADPTARLTIQLWDPLPRAADADRPTRPDPGVPDEYVDEFWVPVIGSLCVAATRLLGRVGVRAGGIGTVSVAALEQGIGLPATGTHVDLVLDRLEQAGLVHRTRAGTVLVRSSFPLLPPHLVDELPGSLLEDHRRWLEARGAEGGGEAAGSERPERVVLEPSTLVVELAEAIEDILTRPDLGPLQTAYRWQAVVRLAEDARDEALVEWAAPDLEAALAECQQAGQAASDAVWAVQVAVAVQGTLPGAHRLTLASAAAGLIDWMVAEFPTVEETRSSSALDGASRRDRLDHRDP